MNLLTFSGLVDAGIGFIVGCFCPAIARKVKSLFVKETQAAENDAKKAVSNAVTTTVSKL